MTDLEKAEKLREKADVSFTEAKEALIAADGDILDALIFLENRGKATVPSGGGYFTGSGVPSQYGESQQGESWTAGYGEGGSGSGGAGNSESFKSAMKKLGKFIVMLFDKGNKNYLDAAKDGRQVFSCPVSIAVILFVCFFWLMVPMFVISLFCGLRYSFRGNDLGKESVNRVMDSASSTVNEIKKSFTNDSEKV